MSLSCPILEGHLVAFIKAEHWQTLWPSNSTISIHIEEKLHITLYLYVKGSKFRTPAVGYMDPVISDCDVDLPVYMKF